MKLERISLEHKFNPDNILTSHEIFTRKTKTISDDGEVREEKDFADNSLFSKRIFGDMDTEEEYSCECGKLKGRYNEGNICPKCGQPVKFVGMNIDKYGWIDLSMNTYNEDGTVNTVGNGFYIMKKLPYEFLEGIIERKTLKNIIHIPDKITKIGNLDLEEIAEVQNSDPKCKYWYIGLQEFYKRYNEVLDYYYNLSNKKDARLYEFLKDRSNIFTNKIPVISIILRPAMRTKDGIKLDTINIKYQSILKNLEILRNINIIPLITDLTIEEIQAEYFMLSDEILDGIKSKSGLIRKEMCGTRINFSARNIISPAIAGYKMDEIVLPYLTFLELYKFEIINILMNTEHISPREAEEIWYKSTLEMNETVYLIMKEMIQSNEIGVLLNRNPTIAYGSILYLRVAAVKHDYNDITLSFHNLSLTPMGADFDGDVLNLISIKDSETREVFKRVFSPITLIIDPNNGRFNNAFNLEKDQVLGLNTLLH